MDINIALQASAAVIAVLANKRPLQEFELLAYEQACRVVESLLKECREAWEETDEAENYSG